MAASYQLEELEELAGRAGVDLPVSALHALFGEEIRLSEGGAQVA